MRLLLASTSPRRADLLRAAGIPFEVRPADVDETPFDGERAAAYVERLSRAKSRAVAGEPGTIVLGADTTVVVDGRVLGKPASPDEARAMLRALSGRMHEVLTGVWLTGDDADRGAVDLTRVHFLPLEQDEIDWYVASGEPEGKAGAYGIQGRASRFVDRIEGSYTNVVGLPVSLVYRLLREVGWQSPSWAGAAR